MYAFAKSFRLPASAAIVLMFAIASGCAMMHKGDGVKVTLSGSEEVPPVSSPASGSGRIVILPDRSVSGSVTVIGMATTVAHIHEAARGINGPVIVPLVKNGDSYSVPPGAKLTDAQYASYLAGNLYVNVHSAANPPGEIRGQLKP